MFEVRFKKTFWEKDIDHAKSLNIHEDALKNASFNLQKNETERHLNSRKCILMKIRVVEKSLKNFAKIAKTNV